MPLINGKFTELTLPAKHARVLLDNSKPWAYRILYGGRNGYKDWSCAAVLIERAIRTPTRVLCAREIMDTLKESIYQLLVDTIERLGYKEYFEVLKSEIRCKINDSRFIFKGLRDLNADNIKSIEGIDVCTIGEGQYLTEKSFNILDPTIRKKGSEIWIQFNTGMVDDFVYQRFIVNPPEDAIVGKVNYDDAPWASEKITAQAERMKKENEAVYKNIWLGEPSTIGRFFHEFGLHNEESCYGLPDDCESFLYGSLDHGIAHDTSFGLWYVGRDGYIHRLCSYLNNGGTAKDHALAIWDMIESFPYTRGLFPAEVYFDPSMNTKEKLSDRMYRSVLDEYLDVFAAKQASSKTRFVAANNRKIDGCQLMKAALANSDGRPLVTYFKGYNNQSVSKVKSVLTDQNNLEIYAKQDGDDAADEWRYGIVAGITKAQQIRKAFERKDESEFLLTRETYNINHSLR
jgi:hypothetical protein